MYGEQVFDLCNGPSSGFPIKDVGNDRVGAAGMTDVTDECLGSRFSICAMVF